MSAEEQHWQDEGCRRLLAHCRNLGLFLQAEGAVLGRHAGRARRSSARTLRVTLGESARGAPIFSAKILARSSLYVLNRIADIQTRLGRIGAFRVPGLRANWEDGEYIYLVEDHISDAISLGRLVADGEFDIARGREILGSIASHIYDGVISEHVTPDQDEINGLFRAIREAPMARCHRDRLLSWTEANLSLLRHRPILTNRDITSGNVLRAASGTGGDNEWWLVDFDLATATTMFWQDCLRSANITGWGVPFWDPAWGRPEGLAFQALIRVLEWDLQRRCAELDADAFAQIRPLQAACDSWDNAFGGSAELPVTWIPRKEEHDPRDDFQLFWNRGSGFIEEESAMLSWRADSVLGSHTFSLPHGPVPSEFRLDPAAGPCGVLITAIVYHGEDGTEYADLANLQAKGDAIGAIIDGGYLIASIGSDPQIILLVPSRISRVIAVTVAGVKSPGIDRELADRLAQSNHRPVDALLPLVQKHHAHLSGQVTALEHLLATETEALAAAERNRVPALAAVEDAIGALESMRTDQARSIAQVEVALDRAWPLFRSLVEAQESTQRSLEGRIEALTREAAGASAAARFVQIRLDSQIILEQEHRQQIADLRQSIAAVRVELDRAAQTRSELDSLLVQSGARADSERGRAEQAEELSRSLQDRLNSQFAFEQEHLQQIADLRLTIVAVRAELVQAQDLSRSLQDRLSAQLAKDREHARQIDDLRQSLALAQADLARGAQSRLDLERFLSDASARADEDLRRRNDLQDRHDALTGQYSALINSRSWWITRPLRWLKSLITR